MTPEEFSAVRAAVGSEWGPRREPDDFKSGRCMFDWQHRHVQWLVNVSVRNLRRWERPDGRGPHPSSARILRWASEGWRRPEGPLPDWCGDDFAEARKSVGMTRQDAAELVGVDEDIIRKWEEERGPHPSAIAILYWHVQGIELPIRPA